MVYIRNMPVFAIVIIPYLPILWGPIKFPFSCSWQNPIRWFWLNMFTSRINIMENASQNQFIVKIKVVARSFPGKRWISPLFLFKPATQRFRQTLENLENKEFYFERFQRKSGKLREFNFWSERPNHIYSISSWNSALNLGKIF